MKTILVGSLSPQVTQEQLQSLFEAYGEITGIDVVMGQEFAYVRMADDSEAYRAIRALNGMLCCGCRLSVGVAQAYSHRTRQPAPDTSPQLAVLV